MNEISSPLFGLGGFELLILLPLAILVYYPLWRIFRRLGYSPGATFAWLVAISVPGVLVLAIWYLAFTAWPALHADETAA